MKKHQHDSIAIIGAGPGGLATAMLLGAAGLRVRVYESCPVVGGRTSRITLQDERDADRQFHFDRGPTFFMMPYVLEEIFNAAGIRLQDYAELSRLDPMYRLMIGREGAQPRVLDTTQNLEVMTSRLETLEKGAGASFKRFMNDNRRKLALMTPILRSPIRSVLDLLNWETMKAGTVINPHQSVYDYLGKYFKTDAVKLALSFQSKYLGMSPYECPSLFSILPFIEYEYGIWHPKGGCNALMSAMADAARSMGVEIVTDAPVARVMYEGKRAVGVEVSSRSSMAGTHRHAHVVINADATWAMKNLIPESVRRSKDSDANLDAKRYSCSTFMMYLGVEGEVELPHHTIYVSASYRENIDDISVRQVLSRDPSVYVCNPSRTDATLARAGDSALYVLVPTPNTKGDIDWKAEKSRLRRQTFEQLSRVMGLADLESRVRAEMILTPDDWRASGINHGATFSLAHTLGQMLHKRPQHRLQGVENTWLVGGGTHPGSGLPVIFLSSQITAKLLCEEMGVAYPAGGQTVSREVETRPVLEPVGHA